MESDGKVTVTEWWRMPGSVVVDQRENMRTEDGKTKGLMGHLLGGHFQFLNKRSES